MSRSVSDKTKKTKGSNKVSEKIFYETYYNEEWLRFQKDQKKTSLFLKIYVFFGFPIPNANGKSAFHIFLGSPQSKLSYLTVPFVVLFNIVRLLVVTSINILKLFTEFGPACLRNFAQRYAQEQDDRKQQHQTNHVFFATLLLRLVAGLYLLGLATTSPIKAMKKFSKIGWHLGKGHGNFVGTSLWFLFGFLSLALTTTIYTFILPFAIQAVVIYFPVAAAATASFFAANFPNLVAIGIAASPVIMAGVEAFGAIVLALILLTDVATSLAQKCIGDKIEKALLKENKIRNSKVAQVETSGNNAPSRRSSLDGDEYLLVEENSVDSAEPKGEDTENYAQIPGSPRFSWQ